MFQIDKMYIYKTREKGRIIHVVVELGFGAYLERRD
jgi:hypothetical protein